MRPPFQIRLMRSDEAADLFLRCLIEIAAAVPDYELLPTRRNAEQFAEDVLRPGIENADPLLVAGQGRAVVGATFTTITRGLLDTRYKSATGHGTWVRPDWRRRGVARALMAEAERMLRAAGVKRHFGIVHEENFASKSAFGSLGFGPVAQVFAKHL